MPVLCCLSTRPFIGYRRETYIYRETYFFTPNIAPLLFFYEKKQGGGGSGGGIPYMQIEKKKNTWRLSVFCMKKQKKKKKARFLVPIAMFTVKNSCSRPYSSST